MNHLLGLVVGLLLLALASPYLATLAQQAVPALLGFLLLLGLLRLALPAHRRHR